MLDILGLSPHPDDIELSCGGFIAKMGQKGYRVGIIDLTKGEMGTEGTGEMRIQEAEKAAEILGVEVRENLDFGDCHLDSSFSKSTRLADMIRKYRPSFVIAPYGDGHHPDHAMANILTKKAMFLAKLPKIETDHEAYSVGIVVYYMLHKAFDASFIVDVSECYEKKLASIKAYKSQTNLVLKRGGLLERVKLRDQFFGLQIGVERGEPYFFDGPLMIDDPVVTLK